MSPVPDRFAQLSPLKRALLAIDELQARLDASERAAREPIAIVGIGCRIPGGVSSPEALWTLLQNGVSAVREVPADRWDIDKYYDADPDAPGKMNTRRGGFLDSVDTFDAALFGIAPREAATMDPQQRLLLEVAWEALEHAGIAPDRLAGTATGVFVGICATDYIDLLKQRDHRELDGHYASGIAHSVASGRLAYLLGLVGPAISIDTACSSSLVSVHLACQSLRASECRMAIAGGVNLILTPEHSIVFTKSRMLAADGVCRTFDAAADGFVRGEGCGLVVLKRYRDAVADGDRVLAVIRGTAINQDGASSSLTAPNGPSQEAVIGAALANGGLEPRDVVYVEAHGTGTSLGDPIEVQALAGAFGIGRDPADPLLIGSLKTNVGHLEAAAGVTGLIKAVLAVQHGEIPPHLNLTRLNPHVDWESLPLAVPTTRTPWPAGRARIAGVSSFGFSGTNAHIIVEGIPAIAPAADAGEAAGSTPERPMHVLAVSARTEGSLARRLTDLRARVANANDADVANVVFSANVGRAHLQQRVAVVARSAEDLRRQLDAAGSGRASPDVSRGASHSKDGPRIAFLFTGQGAQYAGMGKRLYETQPAFREAFDRCADALNPHLPADLRRVVFDQAGSIDQTGWTQPALFAVEYALAAVWQSWGVKPGAVLGHSIGELAAACVAGVLSLEDAARLVAVRGRMMQALPEGGAMTAVFADEARVASVIAGIGDLTVAAVNGPASVVISGAVGAMSEAIARFGNAGVRTKSLAVSHAFHSPLLDPMLDAFEREAATVRIQTGRVPVISNLTGKASSPDAFTPGYWRRHAREAVRFADGIRTLYEQGYRVFVECGPNPTLIGMGKLCVDAGDVQWVPSLKSGQDDWEGMCRSVAGLYTAGVEIDWPGFDRPYGRAKVAVPTYPFERERFWVKPGKRRSAIADPDAHPLLGRQLSSPALNASVFEAVLDADALPYLYDHRVLDTPIMPAAGYLEMALAAARLHDGTSAPAVTDLAIHQAMVLPLEGTLHVQTVVTPGDQASARIEIFSRPGGDPAARWTLHIAGRAAHAPASDSAGSDGLANARGRCQTTMAREAFYEDLNSKGLDFGPAFTGVREIWCGEREVLARVSLDAATAASGTGWSIHPALLDACIQPLAATMREGSTDVFLPIGLERLQLLAPPPAELWADVRLREVSERAGTLLADITAYDAEGRPVVRLTGLRLRRADAQSAGWAKTSGIDDWMYDVRWEPSDLPGDQREHEPDAVPLGAVAEQVTPLASALADWPNVRTYDEILPRMERASVGFIVRALRSLGVVLEPGSILPRALAAQLKVVPAQVRLFDRLLEILAEHKILAEVAGGWQVATGPEGAAVAADPIGECEAMARVEGVNGAELTLLNRCGASLADVLTGRQDPLELLFPGGSHEIVETMYQESTPSRAFNEMLREGVAAVIDSLLPGRPLRVLEIGGGTGSTTSFVLSQMPAERTEYVFTDISPFFIARAQDKFADHDFLSYRTLDIERDPIEQGIDLHGFDLVIAANVLHATRDLRQTMRHVHRVLRPGGVVVMLEVTRPQHWLDITFGMTDGWWRFADLDLRRSNPLLSRDTWRETLAGCGYGDVAMLPVRQSGITLSLQSVVLARANAVSNDHALAGRHCLLVSDGAGVAASASSAFTRAGAHCTVLHREAIAADAAALSAEPPVTDILYCAGIEQDHDDLMARQARTCGRLLALVQAIVAAGRPNPPRLWIVTSGAQPVEGASTALDPEQATLWGFGHVVALEHPELRAVRVDLDPRDPEPAASLLRELTSATADDRIGYRYGRRFVSRLARHSETAPPAPYRLEPVERGSLERLALRPMERRAPGPNEVEIAVEATALNFKDVMNALGMYPGDPGPLGGECTGRILTVGPGVTGFAPGDPVVALAGGSFASHVVADARLVVPRPEGATPEQAVTIPIAYVTAHFALNHLAQMKAEQRVLIHAAAGGVGLAAVHLARRAGVEIFATAGSDEKRALLRRLGVQHVFSSRTPEFSDEIARITAGRGVDIVLNSLSGDLLARSFDAIAAGGTFLEIGKNGLWTDAQVAATGKRLTYHVIDWGVDASRHPELIGAMLRDLSAAVGNGQLAALPYSVFALDEVVAAFRFMAQGRHTGKIVVRHPAAAPSNDGRLRVVADGTYVITGGLAGLGLLTAEWLASRGARHLALIGRSVPTDEARTTIARLENEGVTVTVASLDVARRDRLAEFLVKLRTEQPPIKGIVHSAGALADSVLQQQTWNTFETVFNPKVAGTAWLDQLTRADALDFFVIYSSVAGVFGSPGQANHSAANAFEDVVAVARRAVGLPATSISWGAWGEVGAAVRHRVSERADIQGLGLMSPERGLDALDRIVASGAPHVVVVPVDWARFADRQGGTPAFFSGLAKVDRTRHARAASATRGGVLATIADAPPARRPKLVIDHVRSQAVAVLGLSGAAAIDDREPLHERGLDSLMAVELRNVLGQSFSQTFPATLLFDYPTVAALAAHITSMVAPPASEASPAAVEPAPAGPAPVDSIEELSDEEVDRLFAARFGKES